MVLHKKLKTEGSIESGKKIWVNTVALIKYCNLSRNSVSLLHPPACAFNVLLWRIYNSVMQLLQAIAFLFNNVFYIYKPIKRLVKNFVFVCIFLADKQDYCC